MHLHFILAILPLLSPQLQAEVNEVQWSYKGYEGPEKWGDLSPEFKVCSQGKSQSPLALNSRSASRVQDSITIKYNLDVKDITNDGHVLRMNVKPGSTMDLNGKMYTLQSVQFHTPGENTMNGIQYPLEIQFVHQANQDFAILGVFVEESPKGEPPNSTLEKILQAAPTRIGKSGVLAGEVLNFEDLVPANKTILSYEGSLTTPPCTEGVKWNVVTAPVRATKKQIEAMQQIFGNNNRPLQARNGRKITKTQGSEAS